MHCLIQPIYDPTDRGVSSVKKKRPSHSELVVAYRTLYLQPYTPMVLVKAMHTALAKIYHPDKGGSAEVMKTINTARDSIEAEESYQAARRRARAEARRKARAARPARPRIRRARSRKPTTKNHSLG